MTMIYRFIFILSIVVLAGCRSLSEESGRKSFLESKFDNYFFNKKDMQNIELDKSKFLDSNTDQYLKLKEESE